MATLCICLRLCVAWWMSVCAPCVFSVQSAGGLFLFDDTPALLTFLHIIHAQGCIAPLSAVGDVKAK